MCVCVYIQMTRKGWKRNAIEYISGITSIGIYHITRKSRRIKDFADPAASVNLLRFEKSISQDETQRSDTESAGRYSRTEVDGSREERKSRISLSSLFKRNKDKVSGADTDTMRTVVTVDDEKHQAAPIAQDAAKQTTDEGGIVYAELDLTQQQQNVPIRHLNEDKTEYAEILYTKSSTEEQQTPKE